MLSRSALLLLSDATKLQAAHARFFLRLCCDYDLRTWRLLSPIRLSRKYKMNHQICKRYFIAIMKLGLLEIESSRTSPRFRIARQFLLSGENLTQWLQDIQKRSERETLTPPAPFFLDWTKKGQRIRPATPLVQ